MNRLNWQWNRFPFTENECCAFKTNLTFVDSVAEIFGPLLQGRSIHIFGDKIKSRVHDLIQKLTDYQITRITVVPSLLRAILTTLDLLGTKATEDLRCVALWICSGEALTKELLHDFFTTFPAGVSLCNFYGSTEIGGDATYETFSSKRDFMEKMHEFHVPIGIHNILSENA
jgi:acyl-coenzyme A synthetase/AMP-(fatty) acid ligase